MFHYFHLFMFFPHFHWLCWLLLQPSVILSVIFEEATWTVWIQICAEGKIYKRIAAKNGHVFFDIFFNVGPYLLHQFHLIYIDIEHICFYLRFCLVMLAWTGSVVIYVTLLKTEANIILWILLHHHPDCAHMLTHTPRHVHKGSVNANGRSVRRGASALRCAKSGTAVSAHIYFFSHATQTLHSIAASRFQDGAPVGGSSIAGSTTMRCVVHAP